MKSSAHQYDFLRKFFSPDAKRAVCERGWFILTVLLAALIVLTELPGKVKAADAILDFTFGTGVVVKTVLSGDRDWMRQPTMERNYGDSREVFLLNPLRMFHK